MKIRNCKQEGCTNPVWSGGLCKNHVARKPLKSERWAVLRTDREGRKKMDEVFKRHTFFMSIWEERGRKSEISGDYLGKEALSTFFHHILPKNKYPEAAYDVKNIIMMTADEHANVENDMYRYDEVNKRREQLLRKYDLI